MCVDCYPDDGKGFSIVAYKLASDRTDAGPDSFGRRLRDDCVALAAVALVQVSALNDSLLQRGEVARADPAVVGRLDGIRMIGTGSFDIVTPAYMKELEEAERQERERAAHAAPAARVSTPAQAARLGQSDSAAPPGIAADVACNLAMLLARSLKKNPRALAQELQTLLSADPKSPVAEISIAGAGFLALEQDICEGGDAKER